MERAHGICWWPRGRVALVLGAILVLVFVVRVGWVAHLWSEDADITRYPDTATYVQPALALERHGTFSVGPHSDRPEYFRTPGYPAFIAAVFVVAGEHELAVLMVQVALSVVAIWIAFVVANRVWGPTEGLVAASILALDPLQFWASGTLLTESLTGFLLLVAVALGFRVFGPGRVGIVWPLLLGLTLALATLVRPGTYYLLVVVAIAFAVRAVRRRSWRPAAAGAALLVPVVLLVGGWQLRNAREVGSWRLSAVEAVNMRFYRAAAIVAEREGTDLATVQRRFRRESGPSPRGSDQGAYFDAMYDRGLDVVMDHPLMAARDAMSGLWREVGATGKDVAPRFYLLNFPGPARVPLALGLVAFWVATTIGAARALMRDRARRAAHLFALGVPLYVLLVSAGPESWDPLESTCRHASLSIL